MSLGDRQAGGQMGSFGSSPVTLSSAHLDRCPLTWKMKRRVPLQAAGEDWVLMCQLPGAQQILVILCSHSDLQTSTEWVFWGVGQGVSAPQFL